LNKKYIIPMVEYTYYYIENSKAIVQNRLSSNDKVCNVDKE